MRKYTYVVIPKTTTISLPKTQELKKMLINISLTGSLLMQKAWVNETTKNMSTYDGISSCEFIYLVTHAFCRDTWILPL